MKKNAARVESDDRTLSVHPQRILTEKHLAAYSGFSETVVNVIDGKAPACTRKAYKEKLFVGNRTLKSPVQIMTTSFSRLAVSCVPAPQTKSRILLAASFS